MSKVVDNFLKYIAFDTQSAEDAASVPSTEKQFALAKLLVEQLKALGVKDVSMSEHCYVYGTIPATAETDCPVVGFLAHMDTSPDFSDENTRPQLIQNYNGGDIILNKNLGIKMSPEVFPALKNYVGKDLITTDGTSLLGGDDKAGIAEIMTMAEYFMAHPEIPHGTIKIAFTPDEEVHGENVHGCSRNTGHFLVFILDVDIKAACLLRQDPRRMGLYKPAPGLLRQAENDAEGLRQTLSPDQGKAYGLYGPPGGKLPDLPFLLVQRHGRSRPLLLHLQGTGPRRGGALRRKRRPGQRGKLF